MNALHAIVLAASLLRPAPVINQHEAMCLAKNIYWEAHEKEISTMDRVRVATTTLVRVQRSGKSVCQIVYEINPGQSRHQFSWLDGGEPDLNKSINSSKEEMRAWDLSSQIAVLKLAGNDLGDKSRVDSFISPHRVRSIPSWLKDKVVISLSEHFMFMASKIN